MAEFMPDKDFLNDFLKDLLTELEIIREKQKMTITYKDAVINILAKDIWQFNYEKYKRKKNIQIPFDRLISIGLHSEYTKFDSIKIEYFNNRGFKSKIIRGDTVNVILLKNWQFVDMLKTFAILGEF